MALHGRVGGLLELKPPRNHFPLADIQPLFSTYERIRKELVNANPKFRDLMSNPTPVPTARSPMPSSVERSHIERLLLDIQQALDLIGDLSEDDPMAYMV